MPSLVSINSISPKLRDILLGLNLKPSPTIVSNNYVQYLSTHTPVGLPFTVTYGTGVLAPILNLQQLGAIWREASYTYNEYQAEPIEYSDSGEVIGGDVKGSNSVKPSYLDANGKLNIKDGDNDKAYNLITSLAKGGVGFNKNGGSDYSIVNNNDIRNTIVGRALSAGGLISDTDLGIIGAQRLAISLANNAAFKLQKETIGRVNLDVFSWIDGKKDDFIVPNYEITVPAGLLGKAVDFLGDLAGFTRPKSQMKTEFFSFDERFTPTGIGNIARANGMLETTGKGQVIALFRNMQANLLNSNFTKQGYAPGIVNKRVDGDDAFVHNVYAYGDSNGEILEDTKYDSANGIGNGNGRWTNTDGSGFEGDYFAYKTDGNGGNFGTATESDFIWSDTTINIDKNGSNTLIKDANTIFGDSPSEGETNSLYQPNRKSILYKTKELFKYGNIATLVNGHLTMTEKSQIQSSVLSNGMMSKGNAALTSSYLTKGASGVERNLVYCRTWTPMDKYDEVSDLIRHKSVNPDGGNYLRNKPLSAFSILENTGFVKIARYATDSDTVRRHMFSIENLAWKDFPWADAESGKKDMPFCEKGPYGGRIMWFPPYDIKFSENTSVNWDKHNFIGRGEPMYTYNNTERTGQISFKVIIDHPNELNYRDKNNIFKTTAFGDEDDHYASYFAGCNLNDILTQEEIADIPEEKPKPTIPITDTPKVPMPPQFRVFFPNDNYTYPNDYPEYESGVVTAAGISNIRTIEHKGTVTTTVIKKTGYELKHGSSTPNIDKYIGVAPDPNNDNKYRNYNLYMGKLEGEPDTDPPRLGPVTTIGMLANDYNANKIDYTANPDGKYLGLGFINIVNEKLVGCVTEYYVDRYNYGLNGNRFDVSKGTDYELTLPGNETYAGCRWSGWLAASDMDHKCQVSYLEALKNHMHYETGPCKDCVIKIIGYASKQCDCEKVGQTCAERNQTLSDKRAESVKKFLEEKLIDPADPFASKRIKKVDGKGQTSQFNSLVEEEDRCVANSPTDISGCKMNRRVNVLFEHDPSITKKDGYKELAPAIISKSKKTAEKAKAKIRAYYKECDYFAKLLEKDPFTFKKLTDKIKFFSPAFHSTTPEGFNSRLTFLQQCTRQGPSVYGSTDNGKKPDNLVFGRPPVCILRIGDFYYSKIIIESLSIDYEPLVWDLNPEGVGVQPMIANVSMNFAFIGGSSLDGPISKLQNALSFNYYANTGLFVGNMADTNLSTKDATTLTPDDKVTTNVYENQNQETTIPASSTAETAVNLDRELLEAGVLSLKYDDFGIFQGKIKGKFTIKSKLSKKYTVKLRTIPNHTNPENNLGSEPIDVQTINLNELKVEFTSKRKTENSLQKWDDYLTDTDTKYYSRQLAQKSLNKYIDKNTGENAGNRDKGWDYYKESSVKDTKSYVFIVEVEEINFSKKYNARWVPNFKVDVGDSSKPDPEDETMVITTYSYKSYLSGGKLDIVETQAGVDANGKPEEKYLTPKEKAKQDKEKAEKEKDDKKAKRKTDRENDKLDRKAKRANIKQQKADVKNGGGSLL